MQITIKPAALEELNKLTFNEGEGFRIEAIFIGSCSIYAEHHLKLDKQRAEDDLFMVEGVPVLVSKESQKHLHERISLDFNPKLGFKLSSDEEVYNYSLQIKKVES